MSSQKETLKKAMAHVQKAVPVAENDPTRPLYHFHPPAQWMNDPNGTIYHQGYYHVFYQHNPFDSQWGPMYWGHTRSRDLVHWEHLPIALAPSYELGETHCFSGCAAINAEGTPLIFYTSVQITEREGDNLRPNQQWAAIGDPALLQWHKHPQNPMLTLEDHGAKSFDPGWRDPFVFQTAGRTFMVVGAAGEGGMPLYEAIDSAFTRWQPRGQLLDLSVECPNFFALDGRWVLLTSAFRPVEYYVGEFDLENYRFQPQAHGALDQADFQHSSLYATNIAQAPDGRCILFGWARGFQETRGWNGCLALPRELTIGADDMPRQTPVRELQSLRGTHTHLESRQINDQNLLLPGVTGDCLEIIACFQVENATRFGFILRRSEDHSSAVCVQTAGDQFEIDGFKFPYILQGNPGKVRMHIFLDKSLLEVFLDDGQLSATRVIHAHPQDLAVDVFAEGGSATLVSLDCWQMNPIW